MSKIELAKYRPAWHFSPEKNWINDPNGLVYFEGEYHLFYQYHPHGTTWGPMHWGHAVSSDLIHWEELGIALYPDENGTIFSGSAVVDWNNTTGFFPEKPGIVAIFTSHNDGMDGYPAVQSQGLAYSHDKGRTWTKYDGNPVLQSSDKIDFRDPKVFWHAPSEQWIMALATGQTISFFTSSNLKEWALASEFGDGIGFHGGVWECPDLFPLTVGGTDTTKWILLVSVGDNPDFEQGSRTQYFIGSFDGITFKADDDVIRWLDLGRDNYAGVSFSDIPEDDGRRIYMGWMSNWRYANQVPSSGWRGSMTLPRVLSLKQTGDKTILVQRPVEEADRYFSNVKTTCHNLFIDDRERKEFTWGLCALDMKMDIEIGNAQSFELIVQHHDQQQTLITLSASEQSLVLDRKKSGQVDFSDMFSRPQSIKIIPGDLIQLRLMLDTASMELFVNNGEHALTSLIFPDRTCEKIVMQAKGGSVKVRGLTLSSAAN